MYANNTIQTAAPGAAPKVVCTSYYRVILGLEASYFAPLCDWREVSSVLAST